MDRLALLALVIAAAGCAAPDPLPISVIEELDRRYVPATAAEGRAPSARDRLSKEALSLDDVLVIAEAMNPELAAARKEVDIATAAIWEARLYPNPSVLLEIEDYRTRDGATSGKMERSAGVSVPLVVGGRIGAASSVAEKERERAAVDYLWRRREILSGVKRTFMGLLASRRNVELVRESRDLAQAFHAAAEARFQAQAVPEIEVLKSAVALAKARSELRTAEKQAALALKALHAAMGNADLPTEKFDGELPARFPLPGLESLRGQVLALHPLLESAAKARETAELELALARAERWPDLALDVTAGRDPEDHAIVEGGLTIPLPLFNRNQARIARSEARIEQAARQADAARNDLLLRLAEAHGNLSTAQERATLYREEIFPKAERAVQQAAEGYRLGKFGQLDVLDAQRTLAEAKAAYVQSLAELNQAAVELEKLSGLRLDPVR